MLQDVSRRTFIKLGAALMSFAAVLKYLSFDRVLGASAQAAPAADEVLPNYLSGRVREITASGFAAESGGSRRSVIFDGDTMVWKKDWSRAVPMEVGDEFVAWGEPNDDGTYTPQKIYFNIANVYGSVGSLAASAESATFGLSGGRQNASVRADSSALVDLGESETPFDPSAPPFHNGDFIQVVGLRTAEGLVATRVLV